MVLIDHRHHHAANVEGLLAARVRCVGENLPSPREALFGSLLMRILLYIAVNRIVGYGHPREPLAWRNVGVVIVAEQDAASLIDVARPVLRLAIEAHDAVVAADALVVFSRDAARIIERALAGEHHSCLGG